MVNVPKLFQTLDGIVGPKDFYEPLCNKVAQLLFDQYEKTGHVEPAAVINQFVEVEEQKKAAGIVQTNLNIQPDDEDSIRAVEDIVKKVKQGSIDYEMSNSQDMIRWQELIKEKANIEKLHISL